MGVTAPSRRSAGRPGADVRRHPRADRRQDARRRWPPGRMHRVRP